ncbi:RDD family protein [Aquibacillus salsiterrae]|uniref:RDD family protein n=1 Tax=Aquibacillus salsiterrae TaxID=2950439 RepID=A0A9X3WE26_9BACI|nr:RDD family protein [Aquibacillus salsiterrae]MDC3418002.1 RDD family protein [Aquibacillus salsiterrae]
MEKAGFWIRAIALIIDSILVGILDWIISAVFGANNDPNQLVSIIISLVIAIGYYVWFQSFNNGQTFGKKIMGIRVTKLDGERVGFGNMFLREIIGKFLSALTLFIGYIIAASPKKRALHDYVAGTMVVRTE